MSVGGILSLMLQAHNMSICTDSSMEMGKDKHAIKHVMF